MKNSIFLFGAIFFLLLACTNDNTSDQTELEGDVNLTFNAKFKGQNLLMYDQTYDYKAGMDLRFQLFQFYISHVSLIREMADTVTGGVELVDIALVSFRDIQTTQAANEGITIPISNIPAGNYKGIRVGIGVADDFNVTQPGDHAAGHPLSDNYWTAAKGYIFTKIEGNADLNDDNDFEQPLTFHIGASELYRDKLFITDLNVPANGSLDFNFTLDVNDIFVQGQDFLDFRTVNKDHTTDMEVAGFIARNLANAISLE